MTQSRFEEPSSPSDLPTPTFEVPDCIHMMFDDRERSDEELDRLNALIDRLTTDAIQPPQLYVPNNNYAFGPSDT